MGLFSFTQEIAMDLGTANTIITTNGKIVVDEPSVVALDRRTDKMIAVGERAKLMYEKENPNIRTVRPLRDGVIADFNACEQMMRGLIKKVNTGRRLFTPSLRMVIGVPSGSTEVELRAVRDSAEHANGRDVYLIFEPMAAAIGIGLDVEAPEGNMIVDIGGGSTEIAVISLGGIVSNNSIRIAGDDLTADIQEYMSRQHNVKVSERMAERIKIHVGAALTDLGEDAPEDYIVRGPNRITALPMEVPVCYQEIAHCLEKSIAKIETAILSALENTPPELYADIVSNGIYLAGAGSAGEIGNRCGVSILTVSGGEGHYGSVVVGLGKVHHLLTLRGYGLTGYYAVNNSALYRRNEGIPVQLYYLKLCIKSCRYLLCHHNVISICVIGTSGNLDSTVGIVRLCPVIWCISAFHCNFQSFLVICADALYSK